MYISIFEVRGPISTKFMWEFAIKIIIKVSQKKTDELATFFFKNEKRNNLALPADEKNLVQYNALSKSQLISC